MGHSIRHCYLFVTLVTLLSSLSFPLPAHAEALPAARTLDRDADPVIVTGAQMIGFAGAPLNQLFVYAFSGGQWRQIPWQFDEVRNGEYMAVDNGLLDTVDELVVMGQDCGDQAAPDNWIGDGGAAANRRYEITVVDPLKPGKMGWIYVYRSTTLAQAPTPDYVSFDYASSVFTTPAYILGFFPQYLGGNRLELNGSGVNVLDRSKFRLKPLGQSVITEEALEMDEPQPKILDGHVRAIAGYQGQAQGILTIAYRSSFYDRIRVDFSWSPVPFEWARASADFNQNVTGGVYYDANTPQGVPVDGSPDSIVTTPASLWQQISAASGTVIHTADASPMHGVGSTYYKDSATVDPADTGDKKSYGEMGLQVNNPIKYVALDVTHYILPPSQPNAGATYYGYFTQPLQSLAGAQWNPQMPTPTPTATGTPTALPTPTRTATATRTPTATATPQPALSVSPSLLSFLTASGLRPITQTITVANSGGGVLAWTASEQAAWLAISPSSGNLAAGASAAITVSVQPGAAGLFEADVTVAAGPGALNSPQKVRVVLSNTANLKRILLPVIVRS